MLHIREIHKVLISFGCIQPFLEGKRQRNQFIHCPLADRHIRQHVLRRNGKQCLLQVCDAFLHFITDCLYHILSDRVNVLCFLTRQSCKADIGKAIIQLTVISCFSHILQQLKIRLQILYILNRTAISLSNLQCLMDALPALFQHGIHVFKSILIPFPVVQLFYRLHLIVLSSGFQPFLRERITHGEMIQSVNGFFNLLVTAAGTVTVYKMQKLRTGFSVGVLQQLLHHICFQQLDLALISYPKSGVQTYLVEVIADNEQTERINRSNLRIVYQR